MMRTAQIEGDARAFYCPTCGREERTPAICHGREMVRGVNIQWSMFGASEAKIEPFAKGSETSEAAARAITPEAETLETLALRLFCHAKRRGLTDHELAKSAGRIKDTMAPRRVALVEKELVTRAVDLGKRRTEYQGRTTRPSAVWIITAKGERVVEALDSE